MKERLVNRVRSYHYVSGVLITQQADPICSKCKAFTNSARALKESIEEFERLHKSEVIDIGDELRLVLSKTKKNLAELVPAENALGQKKAGRCRMPEGVCFIKSSKAILEKI